MKRLIALIVTVVIIGAILASVDRDVLWERLRETRMAPFGLAMFLFIPQNAIMAYRWKNMASHFTSISWSRAIGMILAAQTMNIVLPSKMGDLTKAYFLKRTGALELAPATNLVVFEKMLDLGALCLLAILGVAASLSTGIGAGGGAEGSARFTLFALATGAFSSAVLAVILVLYFVPTERLPFYTRFLELLSGGGKLRSRLHGLFVSSHDVMILLQQKHARRDVLAALSITLWLLHLVQIYCFFLSLNAPVPWLAFGSLMPLAIFVGLLPISLFGVGTRDAAMIFLFAPYYPAAVVAGVGFYVSLRYLVPALAGLPFLQYYLSYTRAED